MEMPISEVLDRFSIVKLKVERIGEDEIKKEYEKLKSAIEEYKQKRIKIKESWIQNLYEINSKIWDLESDIRKGKEKELGLEEVGKRAIEIRELNKKRVSLKNKIIEETGSGFKDVKMNHASE